MRIQHNIPAMNALTHYTNNNSALAKNLEKLSSGYRINSAADDAAGLAISEKMRSQIAGLEKAYDNTNDGISLVQTAEGALTEVNSMLTRLKTLATQSANGTYQQEVDREAIQQETNDILDEIDRISQSTNFNGINLLDGSLSTKNAVGGAEKALSVSVQPGNTAISKVAATTSSVTFTLASANVANVTIGDTLTATLTMDDGTAKVMNFNVEDDGNGALQLTYDKGDGNGPVAVGAAAAANITQASLAQAVVDALSADKSFSETYTAALTTGASGAMNVDLEAKKAGADPAEAIKLTYKSSNAAATTAITATIANPVVGADSYYTMDVSKLNIYEKSGDNVGTGTIVNDMESAIIEVEGQKFAFAYDSESARELEDNGINALIVSEHGSSGSGAQNTVPDEYDGADLIRLINTKLGTSISDVGDATTATLFKMTSKPDEDAKVGKALVLQVGDTNDDYQKVSVSIDDMSSKGIGIAGLDLSSQDAAGEAIDIIKNAVNTVSAQRGRLGALQNRLDHTLNNLDAMTENITSSEAQIRDTNMAKEMTAYTKNNILAQAAQSMLAQANSMPQGVLQLLQ